MTDDLEKQKMATPMSDEHAFSMLSKLERQWRGGLTNNNDEMMRKWAWVVGGGTTSSNISLGAMRKRCSQT